MHYLSVFIPQQPTKPIVVVDLNKPERVSVIDAIYYCDFHNGHAFISNYKNLFTAKFDRRADTDEIDVSKPVRRKKADALSLPQEAPFVDKPINWRMLGDRHGVSHDTLRLAVRDKGRKCHIGR